MLSTPRFRVSLGNDEEVTLPCEGQIGADDHILLIRSDDQRKFAHVSDSSKVEKTGRRRQFQQADDPAECNGG